MALVVLAIVAVLFLFLMVTYNGLVRRRIAVDNAWSQIDVQLKRRHDLIPNLVETIKGYAAHERATLEAVIEARNTAIAAAESGRVAKTAEAENILSGTLKSLFALSESYPDLKANENFLKLQEELASTENRVGFARQHYNDSVAGYQGACETFPSNIVARLFNFPQREFFELDEVQTRAVREAPQVKF